MNFKAMNLDEAYETLKKLNLLSTNDGGSIIKELNSLIINLKEHWVGSDATIHINNLIKIYDSVNKIVQNVNFVSHNTSEPIVNAQTIRNANGGSGNVGEVIPLDNRKMEEIENLVDTKQYYVDPSLIVKDYNNLQIQKGNFNDFCSKFSNYKDELLNNWISGSNRDKVLSDFNEFESDISTFKKMLLDMEQTLSTVISNLKQI